MRRWEGGKFGGLEVWKFGRAGAPRTPEWSASTRKMKFFEKVCHRAPSRAYLQVVKLVAQTEASSSALRFCAFMEVWKFGSLEAPDFYMIYMFYTSSIPYKSHAETQSAQREQAEK